MKVSKKLCETCAYRSAPAEFVTYHCDYASITHKVRNDAPGTCTCYVRAAKIEQARAIQTFMEKERERQRKYRTASDRPCGRPKKEE